MVHTTAGQKLWYQQGPSGAHTQAQSLQAENRQYKDYIKELLETYKDPPPTGQRVFELIREKGYPGGRTIVNYYLADVRGKQTQEPVICVETPAGQRGSHDWSEYYVYLSDKGEKEKIIFFSFILNYSRRQYIEVVEDKTQTSLFQCLINTFVYFDGVPREIKSDNQKACVDRWESGKPVFNKTFLEFASHYCFTPLTIHPGKPRDYGNKSIMQTIKNKQLVMSSFRQK